MRKISKAVAAAGLAATVVVTGLSFGSAAATAAPSEHVNAAADVQFIWKTSETAYKAVTSTSPSNSDWDYVRTATYSSLLAAQNGGLKFNVRPIAGERTFLLEVGDTGRCLSANPNGWGTNSNYNFIGPCNAQSQAQLLIQDAQGHLKYASAPDTQRRYLSTSMEILNWIPDFKPSNAFIGIPGDLVNEGSLTSVKVESTDVEGRSAVISGKATAGAKLLFNGGGQITVPESGSWTKTISGLSLGKNDITVEQYVDGTKKDEKTVTADLAIAPLAASVAWNGSDEYKDAVVSGSAEKGATVEAFNGTTKIGSSQASSSTGEYSFGIDAPNTGGDASITVKQKVGDDYADDAKDLTVQYGAGIDVTSPGTGDEHTGGKVRLQGTGAADGRIVVREQGSPNIIANGDVMVNGRFDITTTIPLDDKEHVLDVTQTSKGNNVTKETVTLNPGKSNELSPATVTTKSYVAGKSTLVEGTATAGATIEFLDAKGGSVAPSTSAAADGTWSFTKTMPAGSTDPLVFTVKQTLGDKTLNSDPFTLTSDLASFSPVTVSTKTVLPGFENTFRGTATPGATLRILNASGTQIVNGTVTVAADGSYSFNRVVSSGAAKLDFKVEQTKDGKTITSSLFSIKADASTIPAPVTVTTASAQAGIKNTFEGTGPKGATYRVLNASGTQIVPGTHTIDATTGRWSFDRIVSSGATKLDFKLEITLADGRTYGSKLFSVKTSVFALVTVTNTSVTAGVENTFSGTATPGATYRVLNVSGTQIVPGTFTVGADGKWEFKRVVATGASEFRFALEQTKNGQTEVSQLFTLKATK